MRVTRRTRVDHIKWLFYQALSKRYLTLEKRIHFRSSTRVTCHTHAVRTHFYLENYGLLCHWTTTTHSDNIILYDDDDAQEHTPKYDVIYIDNAAHNNDAQRQYTVTRDNARWRHRPIVTSRDDKWQRITTMMTTRLCASRSYYIVNPDLLLFYFANLRF